jgi:hypothetical protein
MARPPLWTSGQSSWLQIQSPGFIPRRYHIFGKVVGLKRSPPSLVITIEEQLEKKIAAPIYKAEITDAYADYSTPLYPEKLVVTSQISNGRSVGIVRSRPQAMEISFIV